MYSCWRQIWRRPIFHMFKVFSCTVPRYHWRSLHHSITSMVIKPLFSSFIEIELFRRSALVRGVCQRSSRVSCSLWWRQLYRPTLWKHCPKIRDSSQDKPVIVQSSAQMFHYQKVNLILVFWPFMVIIFQIWGKTLTSYIYWKNNT